MVPCLTFGVVVFASTLPATAGMAREPAMESYAVEERHVLGRGYTHEDDHDFEHEEDDASDTFALSLPADACVAVIAVTWGHQYGSRLSILEGERVLSAHADPDGRVLSTQWCSPAADAQALTVRLERLGGDVWGRDQQSRGSVHIGVYRASASAVGGLAGIDRGTIPDAVLAGRPEVMRAADAAAPSGHLLAAPLTIEPFAARLVPEDAGTYAELHRGALNGASSEVNPRVTPLPETSPAVWRPGTDHTQEALRAARAPTEHPTETHPAVRDTDEQFMRVLAVIDADRLGVRCADVQLVRLRYGFRADVRASSAGQDAIRTLPQRDNLATDHICAGQGLVVYVAPLTDAAPYTLRLYEG